jgi:riboflavin kinase / FMN adenylyltransferase
MKPPASRQQHMYQASALGQLAEFGLRRVVLTCGVFDGLHRGHQEILARLRYLAEQHQAAPVMLTFDPHPRRVLTPDKAPRLLLSTDHKLHLLSQLGLAATVVLPFTRELSRLSAEAFLDHYLWQSGLELRTICVGERWRFGHQAGGDVALLARQGAVHGVAVEAMAELRDAQGVVSSTRLRQAVESGDLATCQDLLGRPFSLMGRVAHGKGIATTDLNAPTANIASDNEVFPPRGIYVATAVLHDATTGTARRLPGVLYLGDSPTFIRDQPPRPFVEMHIFDFHEDLYGQILEVEFLHYLRPDAKFDSAAALREQITRDIAAAREHHRQG